MNIKLYIFLGGLIISPSVPCCAQFFTVKSDSNRIASYRIIKQKKTQSQSKEFFKEEDAKEKADNVVVKHKPGEERERSKKIMQDKNQKELFEKLQDRLNVCLPLDKLKVSSNFGNRVDPITRCEKFHDGIDLVCRKENIYSMLPAVVKKVHRGNKGYGNYVILNHGQLECLYGHLEEITVREKEVINAGTIVGISGNTGKSTGPHLHLRLRHNGRIVDPVLFITFLKNYIKSLNKDLSAVVGPTVELRGQTDITLKSLYKEIVRNKILFPKIVLSQALLETGYFSSRVCLEYNNLFGLRRQNGEYYHFSRWEESVQAYRDYVQYKYKGGNYFSFLDRIGYAEDRNYTFKVRTMLNSIRKEIESF